MCEEKQPVKEEQKRVSNLEVEVEVQNVAYKVNIPKIDEGSKSISAV